MATPEESGRIRRMSEAETLVDTILHSVPLIDGHNDIPSVVRNDPLAKGDVVRFGFDGRCPGDTDVPRLRAGRIGAQVWAAFVEADDPHPATTTLELIQVIQQLTTAFPETFQKVLCADDVDAAFREGRIGSITAVENGVGIGNSLVPLRTWHELGVRLITLCHNRSLDWVDSATDAPRCGGLSGFGRAVIAEMNRLGIIVDCAHASPDAMRQVLDVSTSPIAISHSNAFSLCRNVRNIPDDVLDRIPANDGIVMITFIPDFVSEQVREWMIPVRKLYSTVFSSEARRELIARFETGNGPRPRATISQVADHVEYVADRVGVGRVGIGSDFCGAPVATRGLEDVSRIRTLLVEMALRGWSGDHIANLAGYNFLRVFRAVERHAEASRIVHRLPTLPR